WRRRSGGSAMSAPTETARLAPLIRDMKTVADEARAAFGQMTASQLNWKPGAQRWSIGQVFEHLLKTDLQYIPIIEQVVRGDYRPNLWQRFSPLSRLWGGLVLRAVAPESQKKVKAPQVFQPSASSVDREVINRFAAVQSRLS